VGAGATWWLLGGRPVSSLSLGLASNYLGVQIFLEANFSGSWNQIHKHAGENPFTAAQARSREEISGVALESLISDHIPLFDLAAI
jgi:hypothetical protein